MANKNKHILIVDDDSRVLLILESTLERLGSEYKVMTAGNGRDALEIVDTQPVDLIISDVRMPGMDGIQLVEKIRALNSETAIIWITAYGCHRLEAERERLNIYSCLEKPLKIEKIRQAALEALNGKPDLERTDE